MKPRLTVGMLEAMAASLESFHYSKEVVAAKSAGNEKVALRVIQDVGRARLWVSRQLERRAAGPPAPKSRKVPKNFRRVPVK